MGRRIRSYLAFFGARLGVEEIQSGLARCEFRGCGRQTAYARNLQEDWRCLPDEFSVNHVLRRGSYANNSEKRTSRSVTCADPTDSTRMKIARPASCERMASSANSLRRR